MSSAKAASIGTIDHAPDTRLDITPTFPVGYDPDGATAVIEFADADGEIVFRYNSGVDGNLAINGQAIEVRLLPTAASLEESVGTPFADVLPEAKKKIKFNLDMERGGLVEYRFQGSLKILPKHGPL